MAIELGDSLAGGPSRSGASKESRPPGKSVITSMSAKLTVIFFILICFEVGVLLVYLPWHRSWGENHLLFMLADKFHWSGLISFATSGYTRGAVTGLGVINLILCGWEALHFNKTVGALQSEWQGERSYNEPAGPVAVPDNGPPQTEVEPR